MTEHPTGDVRHTTIEALARQLQTDAENLADLAGTLADKQTPVSIEDALDCAELVAGTTRALRAQAA